MRDSFESVNLHFDGRAFALFEDDFKLIFPEGRSLSLVIMFRTNVA